VKWPWRRRSAGDVRAVPEVIVLGNQKSGTSAVASLLADLGGRTKTIDIPALWERRGAEVMRGDRALADVVRADPRPFARCLVKEPMMTFFLDQVREVFPGSKLVFVVRDPRDNARSLLNRRELPGHLDELTDELRAGLGERITVDPAVWGGAGENYVGVLGHRWNLAVENWRRHREACRLVRYEDFLADKLGCLTALARDLGIEPIGDVRDKLDVQYQPRGNRAVSWPDFFGPNLARLERICGESMAEFGYECARIPAP